MDSKLLGSNIAWMSRYSLIHKTLEIHSKELNAEIVIEATLKGKLEEALKMEGDKVVYTHTSQEVQQKLKELGTLISQVLAISECSKTELPNITRVFNEQYEMNDDKIIVARTKKPYRHSLSNHPSIQIAPTVAKAVMVDKRSKK
ncbi:MAG: hypothetical protein IPN86_10480 [Saprospiraceae bacterium]|nr:hypothetical protein [Saprospiraceae bacterium]